MSNNYYTIPLLSTTKRFDVMKRMITQLAKKAAFISGLALLSMNTADAATYTAIASGNFSSTATWQGGLVPPISLANDDVIIPSGMNVVLDQNLDLSGAASVLTVNGTLSGGVGNYLAYNSGSLAGSGTMDIDSISMGFNSGFLFTGDIIADHYTSVNSNITAAADITVNETLELMAGTFTTATGKLTMGNNSTIIIKDGTLALTSGQVNLTNTYHVHYEAGTMSAVNSGIELAGSGLADVMVNVGSGNSVFLSDDLSLNGTLTLSSGNLTLNNNDLTFNSSADLSASGSGKIVSSSQSSITINTMNGLSGGLKLASSSNTVSDFTINLGNSSAMVDLTGGLQVTNSLSLQSGILNAGSNSVILQSGSGAQLMGGSDTSYIITTMGGSLDIDIATNSSQMFYIGTQNNYAPVEIKNNGSATNTIKAGVDAMVLENGTTGGLVTATQSGVNATWFIDNSVTTGADVDMTVWWATNMEVNGFDRNNAYISHYTNGGWDVNAIGAANTSGNMHSLSRVNITSFSPFAVYDNNTALAVSNVSDNSEIQVYPNPAVNNIYVDYSNTNTPVQAAIYSVSGKLVKVAMLGNTHSAIDVQDLSSGMYYIQLNNEDINTTKKFIKQ